MSAAEWLTSDAVTEALARIKAENQRAETGIRCCSCRMTREAWIEESTIWLSPPTQTCCQEFLLDRDTAATARLLSDVAREAAEREFDQLQAEPCPCCGHDWQQCRCGPWDD